MQSDLTHTFSLSEKENMNRWIIESINDYLLIYCVSGYVQSVIYILSKLIPPSTPMK